MADMRLIDVMRGISRPDCAYLSTVDRSWEELNHLMKVPEHIDHWRGTV